VPDLLDLTLTLRPTHRDTIPGWLGRAARALLLHSIEAVHPDLSRILHDLHGDKPFTASTLLGAPARELMTLEPNRTVMLRYTSLSADLTRLMLTAVIPRWQADSIVLHNQPMRVEAAAVETCDYADLWAAAHDPARRSCRITLRFETPTYFKVTGGRAMRLPAPEYVFGKSLLRRWNAFAPCKLPDTVGAFAANAVEVEAVRNLHTRRVSFTRAGKNLVTGFVGEVMYGVPAADADLSGAIHALARFARFSGIGAQTADGLGQVGVVEVEHRPRS